MDLFLSINAHNHQVAALKARGQSATPETYLCLSLKICCHGLNILSYTDVLTSLTVKNHIFNGENTSLQSCGCLVGALKDTDRITASLSRMTNAIHSWCMPVLRANLFLIWPGRLYLDDGTQSRRKGRQKQPQLITLKWSRFLVKSLFMSAVGVLGVGVRPSDRAWNKKNDGDVGGYSFDESVELLLLCTEEGATFVWMEVCFIHQCRLSERSSLFWKSSGFYCLFSFFLGGHWRKNKNTDVSETVTSESEQAALEQNKCVFDFIFVWLAETPSILLSSKCP